MKKSLAILILCIAVLCGSVSAAKPKAVSVEKAGVKVEISGISHYFETLSPELFLWLSTEIGANSTVTLLSDQTLSSKEGTNFLSLGQAAGSVPAIVLDLDGHTIAYNGPSNLFAIPYDGNLTVKNGAVFYECVGNTRSPFVLGATSSQQCDPADAAVPVKPRLTLQNLQVLSKNADTGRVINCFQWMAEITVEDSFLWTNAEKSAAIDMRKSTQKDSDTVQWKGPYTAAVHIVNSTVGTVGNYALASADECTFTLAESALVSAVADKDPTTQGKILGEGRMTTGEWKGALPDGKAAVGVGTVWTVPVPEEPEPERPAVHPIPEWFNPPSTGVNISLLLIPAGIAAAATVLLLTKKNKNRAER